MYNRESKDCFVASLLATTLFFIPSLAWASVASDVNKANDLYHQGKFDDSLDLYQKALVQDAKSPVVNYDLGTAYYKKGDYAKALGYLEQAAQEKNVKIKPKAEYNLGNVLFKSGMQKANTNVGDAIKSLQKALGQYVESVKDDPNDADAKFNEDFVKKEIERLKQQKQQQQNNQQQNQKQQQQKNQKSQRGQQGQQKQQSQQQNQQNQQNQQSQEGQQKKQENHPSSSESQAQKQRNAQDQAEEDQKELDRKQAQDTLEAYQENEEPKKLLNYMPQKIDDRPVLKDW